MTLEEIKKELLHLVFSELTIEQGYTGFSRTVEDYHIDITIQRDRPSDDRMQPETQTLRITTGFDNIEYTSDVILFSNVYMLAEFIISNIQKGHKYSEQLPF